MEQPEKVKLQVDEEPTDYTNWRFDGINLIRDVENVTQPEPEKPTEIELLKQENTEMKEQLSELTDAVLFMSENMGG
ncbi:hypothetical protein [Enterococcus rotai]|uniref:hypothetical protein n=1 Tax=Enterococcus rotai TaxID=118060 RepID=UPI0032B3A47D